MSESIKYIQGRPSETQATQQKHAKSPHNIPGPDRVKKASASKGDKTKRWDIWHDNTQCVDGDGSKEAAPGPHEEIAQ